MYESMFGLKRGAGSPYEARRWSLWRQSVDPPPPSLPVRGRLYLSNGSLDSPHDDHTLSASLEPSRRLSMFMFM